MQYICQSQSLSKLWFVGFFWENKIVEVWEYLNVPFQQLLSKDMKCFDL